MKIKYISVKEFCALTSKNLRAAQRFFKELKEQKPELFILEEDENGREVQKISLDHVLEEFPTKRTEDEKKNIRNQYLLEDKIEELQQALAAQIEETEHYKSLYHESEQVIESEVSSYKELEEVYSDAFTRKEELEEQMHEFETLNFRRSNTVLISLAAGAVFTLVFLYLFNRYVKPLSSMGFYK